MSLAAHPYVKSTPGAIDTRNLLSVCREGEILNQALLREMLGYFIDENRRRMLTMAHAVATGQRETLRQTAHALRGSAAMLGAGRLHDLAWGVELDAAQTDLVSLDRAVIKLDAEFNVVLAALHQAHPEAWLD
jgi:HPt (histidine-containing phosphotransfer) domain-containing protein